MNTQPRTEEGKFIPGIIYSPETMFSKGHEPINKGKKFPGTGNSESFKKGNLPHNTKYDGAITTRTNKQGNNYMYIRLECGKWEFLQRYNWMNANGPIPAGKILCCKDGNSLNCDPNNWELKTRAEHGSSNRNIVKPMSKTCPICNKDFETRLRQAKYCSDECQREKTRSHMREFQREKRAAVKEEVKRNCVVCGKEFTLVHSASKICSDECYKERQRAYNASYFRLHSNVSKKDVSARNKANREATTGICMHCGKDFTKTNATNELCSTKCKRARRNELRGAYVRLTEPKEKAKPMATCLVCGIEFTPNFGMKMCSSKCRIQATKEHRKAYVGRVKASKPARVKAKAPKVVKVSKPVKVKIEAPVVVKAIKPIKVKSIRKVKEKPIKQVVHIQSLNKKQKKNEKDAALNMHELNRNAPANDREKLIARQIESPNISEMQFRVYDKALKITRYFRTEEKYLNYLNKQENEKVN